MSLIHKAAELIINSKNTTVFTGAGISVESGIPPFRGNTGIWSQYDPIILDIDYYYSHPMNSWPIIKKLFYDFFGDAHPNKAHQTLASWENKNLIKTIITQNIDHLHQTAGSVNVLEFHGTSQSFVCAKCQQIFPASDILLNDEPPRCLQPHCNSILKPNFIFFGESIESDIYKECMKNAETSDVYLIIGTTGEVMPACQIPVFAKQNGAQIIEINTAESHFTNIITDIFLQGKASMVMKNLDEKIKSLLTN